MRGRQRFIEEVRGDDPELVSRPRIEERELEAGGLDGLTCVPITSFPDNARLRPRGSPPVFSALGEDVCERLR
jgi:hypothetical protein